MGFAAGSFTRKYLQIFDLAAGAIGTVLTVYFAYHMPREGYLISIMQCFSITLACYAFAVSCMDMKYAGDHNAVNLVCRDRYRLYAAAVFSIAVSFFFFARSMNSRSGSFLNQFSWMNRGNVKAYAVMLILFGVLFLILILWFKNIFKDAVEITFDRNAAYSAVLIFCACVSRFVFYGNEGKIHNAVPWLLIYAAVFIGIYISIWLCLDKQRDRSSFAQRKHFENSICFMVYGIVVLASSLKQTIINCWGKGFSDIFHCHGYFSPISYVVNGNAFLGGWIDKYGHYGLWYKPIMDIFGNTSLVMGIIFGIANGVTVIIFLYLIHKTTDNLMIRLCCAVALGISSIAGHMYPMTLTNRLFVVALTLFLIWKSSDSIMKSCSMKKMLWIEFIGVIIGTFTFITSTDAGIISNFVWTLAASLMMVYVVGKDKTEEKISGKIMMTLKSLLFHFLLFALEILLAYAVIKVWNYNHADIPVHKILEYADEFDFQSEAEGQNNKFIFQNGIWIYILITFMMVFACKFKNLLVYYTDPKGRFDIMSIFAFSLSVISFGMFVFYVSRPEDFLCIGDLFITCVCLLAEQASALLYHKKNEKMITIEKLVGTVIMTGCVLVFTVGFFNVGNAVNNEYNYIVRYHQLDWRRLTEEFEKFQQDVPESTYVMDDVGLSMIYMNIGREMPDDMENCDYIICPGLPDDFEWETEFIKFVSVDAIEYSLYRIVR